MPSHGVAKRVCIFLQYNHNILIKLLLVDYRISPLAGMPHMLCTMMMNMPLLIFEVLVYVLHLLLDRPIHLVHE